MQDKNNNEPKSDKQEDKSSLSVARSNVVGLLDDFIYKILSIRKMLFALFVSSIVFAPISIGLSIYLLTHPSFDNILNAEDNFGEVLEVLLFSIFAASSIWLVIGIKQYQSIGSWNKKFSEYQREQNEIEKKIILKYGLSDGED